MNTSNSPDPSADRSHHVIFVDGAGEEHKQTYESDVVDAVTIITEAGYEEEPDQYILEALRGQSGAVVEEFDPQGDAGPTKVDLTEQHREHFQVTTRGEVFI
jgi:hypothetical protein